MKHIVTITVAFMVGYASTEVSSGFRYVPWHFDFLAILNGLLASGLYVGGAVQQPMFTGQPSNLKSGGN